MALLSDVATLEEGADPSFSNSLGVGEEGLTGLEPEHFSMDAFNPSTIFNVEDMVAVITGGGTGKGRYDNLPCTPLTQRSAGIGLIMAAALESNGATVYIVGRRREVLEKAAQEHNVRASLPTVFAVSTPSLYAHAIPSPSPDIRLSEIWQFDTP